MGGEKGVTIGWPLVLCWSNAACQRAFEERLASVSGPSRLFFCCCERGRAAELLVPVVANCAGRALLKAVFSAVFPIPFVRADRAVLGERDRCYWCCCEILLFASLTLLGAVLAFGCVHRMPRKRS